MIWGSRIKPKYVMAEMGSNGLEFKEVTKIEWHLCRTPWLPVRLIDGRWSWFEPVHRVHRDAHFIRAFVPSTFFGGWCYRLTDRGK